MLGFSSYNFRVRFYAFYVAWSMPLYASGNSTWEFISFDEFRMIANCPRLFKKIFWKFTVGWDTACEWLTDYVDVFWHNFCGSVNHYDFYNASYLCCKFTPLDTLPWPYSLKLAWLSVLTYRTVGDAGCAGACVFALSPLWTYPTDKDSH